MKLVLAILAIAILAGCEPAIRIGIRAEEGTEHALYRINHHKDSRP